MSRPLDTDAVEGIPRQGILAGIQGNGHDSSPTSTAEKLSREKRVLLTLAEEREIERLVARVAEELATPVKLSHMLRAYMTLLLHAEGEITKRARLTGPLHRPPNGDAVALAGHAAEVADADDLPIEPDRSEEGGIGELIVVDVIDLQSAGI